MIAPFTGHSSAYYSVIKDLFEREKKPSFFASRHSAKNFLCILYISWVLHHFQKTCLPVLLITTTKKVCYSKTTKRSSWLYLYHKSKNLSSIFSKPKSYTILFKICQVLFFFCTLLSKIFKRTFCNSDLQWAYLYHTFKNLSSEKFCHANFEE